jgi:hypothetical protein
MCRPIVRNYVGDGATLDYETDINAYCDLLEAALAVDLEEWVWDFGADDRGDAVYYQIQSIVDGHRDMEDIFPFNDFLPLAIAIAQYQAEGGE